VTFDIDLDKHWDIRAHQIIQSANWNLNCWEIFSLGKNMVHAVQVFREAQCARNVRQAALASAYTAGKAIEGEIKLKMCECFWNGFYGRHMCPGCAARQHRVAAHIGAYIKEMIIRSQKVKHESHVPHFVQSAVPVAGGSGHTALCE
jgi:hypothetical protein